MKGNREELSDFDFENCYLDLRVHIRNFDLLFLLAYPNSYNKNVESLPSVIKTLDWKMDK